jgi:hypothetical protein
MEVLPSCGKVRFGGPLYATMLSASILMFHRVINDALLLHRFKEYPHFVRRPQVVNTFGCRSLGNKLPVPGSEVTVAAGDNAIAIERAAPHWAVLWPALWIHDETFDQPLGDPDVVSNELSPPVS